MAKLAAEYHLSPAEFADLTIPQIEALLGGAQPGRERESALGAWAARKAIAKAREVAAAANGEDGGG